MSLRDKLPGMTSESGHKIRNVVVGAGYLFLAMMIMGAIIGPADTETADTAEAQSDTTTEEEKTADESKESDSDSDSTESKSSEKEPEPEQTDITAEDVEAVLASNGLDVTVHNVDGIVIMEYNDTVANEEELAGNLGTIAGVHAEWYAEDPSIGMLNIEMYNSQTGQHAGSVVVDEDKTQAYNDGEISANEYAYEILSNLEAAA